MAKELQSSSRLEPGFVGKLDKLKSFIEPLARHPGKMKEITEKQISDHTEELKKLSNILANPIA